jgi:hypothetical protein
MENVRVTFTDRGSATVETEGGTYAVDTLEGTCTCPDNRIRGSHCRHLVAVDQAAGMEAQNAFSGAARDQGAAPAGLPARDAENERDAEGRNLRTPMIEDNFFYTNNPEAYHEDVARLRDAPVPYYRENALNGSENLTFGIELEFRGGDSNAIAAELHGMGICGQPQMTGYHGRKVPGKWALEKDSSVTVGNRGGELISPVLKDTPETWRQLETICEVAKRHGARVDTHTGAHVHIGAAERMDGKKQRWRRFFKITSGFHDVYLRLSGGEQGIFRGEQYAASSLRQSLRGISAPLPGEENEADYHRSIGSLGGTRYLDINLQSFASSKKTIEFRGFNGSLTPGIIQANVKFAAGVVTSAQRSRVRGESGLSPSSPSRKRGRMIGEYARNNAKTDESVMKALDVVFSRKQDKEHILSVILKNRWFEGRD